MDKKGSSLRITPVIRNAIALLRLSNQELGGLIKKELEKNPLLLEDRGVSPFCYQLEFNFGSSVPLWCDILISKKGGIRIKNNCIPKIKIGSLVNFKNRDVKYNRRLNSARWLIGGIKRREDILKGVLRCAVKKQRDFLAKGKRYIKPLTIKEIADSLRLNPSTVSRVVSNKYILTPRGVLKLRDLFKRPVNNNGNKNISKDFLKEVLGEIIKSEEKGNILRDEEIREFLGGKDITVSRRTVSQYRAMLGIPAYRRRIRRFL